MRKKPYIVIAGPTASGKTGLSIQLAKALDGQVVSADSMQVYREIAVGTARPTEEEMDGVTHHLLGFVPLHEKYSVARYLEDANAVFAELMGKNILPILCGGTGLYIQSFMENRRFFVQQPDSAVRQKWENFLAENGEEALLRQLEYVDTMAASRLHPHDTHRVIRALEVYETTGHTISQQDELSKSTPSPYEPCSILLDFHDRQRLYERINRRVDGMLRNGLLEEAQRVLQTNPEATVTQAIGYKEFRPYFEGECTLEETVDRLKQQTRRYAKRQLSWFRRMPFTKVLYIDEYATEEQLTEDALQQFTRFCEGEEDL